MARLTREQILARKLGEEDVDLGDGDTVLVRGLNRDEAHELQQLEGTREREVFMVATGMVEPEMSTEDVHAWYKTDEAGAINRVAEKITTLSGMAPGQAKEYTKSVPRRRRR